MAAAGGEVAAVAAEAAVPPVIFEGPPPAAADLAAILWSAPAESTRSIRIKDGAGDGGTEAAPGAFAFLVRFGFDSTEILPESRPYLDSVGAMLALPEAEGRRLAIVGHADASGSDAYNLALSERRAAAVEGYLRDRFGVEPGRVAIAGRGEREPLPDVEPTAARNRRVEFRAAGD